MFLSQLTKLWSGGLRLTNFRPCLADFLVEFQVLDHVFRGLGHDPPPIVESFAPGPPADLMEIARAENASFLAVEFAEAGEQDGADGDVDADAQGVGAADDLEQAALGELFDEHAVLGEQTGVMHANALLEPRADVWPIGTGELESGQFPAKHGFFLARADVEAGEILRALSRFGLCEMHHIDRRFALAHQPFERLGQRRLRVRELERHRALDGFHRHARLPVAPGQFLLEEAGVAECGRHEEEPRLRQRQERHLPGHAAVAVGVPVELVHDDVPDVGLAAFAQGDVGQDLRGAAEDGRVAVDRGVARAQADVVGTELAAERHPLLVDKSLDGAGVNRAVALGQRLEMQRRGDQRLARPGRGIQDDVLLIEQFQNRLFLRRVEVESLLLGIVEKPFEQEVVAGVVAPRQQIVKRDGHGFRKGQPLPAVKPCRVQ